MVNVSGISSAPYPIRPSRKGAKVRGKKKKASKKHKQRLQCIDDESVLDSVIYDLPADQRRGAIAMYNSISALSRREQVNFLFGVDVYA
ncbi:MAG: hypothetical protein CENE_03402 [Candidatus Celerinatantimonas neptuna]|nr:MAG: hypothetical protein CENE_03402 [Candidatus Celerinatantimonas neptuna]